MLDSFVTRLAQQDGVFVTVWSLKEGVERRLSFGAFGAAAAAGAASWTSLDVGSQVRVALLSKGTLDFYVALVSLQCVGATPVLLNWRQPLDALKGCVEDAGATVVAAAAPFHAVATELPGRVVAIDGGVWQWSLQGDILRWTHQVAKEAAVFFTSGSTSRPKAVVHTHATLLWTADNTVAPAPTSTTLCFLPNFHVLMCFQNFLMPMVRGLGASVHGADATEPITARLLLAAAAALHPATIDTVPFIAAEWASMTSAELAPLAACVAVRCGGAALAAAVARRLVDAGITLQTHYGQTEMPGMQLLTVKGAAPDELAIMTPPWSCVVVDLANSADQGELVIHGCRGSSPGYLDSNGVNVRRRLAADGWQSTGDVFRWATTRSGAKGLVHVMRQDDVLVLSTGEQFNPVPLEERVHDYLVAQRVKTSGLVVLGRQRPAPFLIVELADDANLTEAQALELLLPGLHAANAPQVEYGRIRGPGYVAIVAHGTLPTSAKGNVQRAKAEVELRSLLDHLEQQQQLDDCVHLDSLGVVSRFNKQLREAERVGDNVKALVITCIVMTHWYGPKFLTDGAPSGSLDIFYAATRYKAVSWGVQYATSTACLVLGFFQQSPTASMLALFASVGWTDGVRDAFLSEKRVTFGRREATLVILVVFYKVLVYLASACAFKDAWKPANLHVPSPLLVAWYLYALLWYRAFTWVAQRFLPPCALVALAVLLPALMNWGGDDQYSCALCAVPTMLPRGLGFFLSFLVNSDAVLVVPSSLPNKQDWQFSFVSQDLAVGVYESPPVEQSLRVLEPKILVFYAAWLVGYYYGDAVVSFCRRRLPRPLACASAVLALNVAFASLADAWVDGSVSTVPQWIWQHRETVETISAWNPVWARPLYVLVEWLASSLLALLVLAGCVGVSWRARRCGNAALGKFFFMQLEPTSMYVWLCWLVSRLGERFGPDHPVVALIQLGLLLSWPFAFVYVVGPFLTAVVVAVPRFVFWLVRRPSLEDVTLAFDGAVEWCETYVADARRDVKALHDWITTDPHTPLLRSTAPSSYGTTLQGDGDAADEKNKQSFTTLGPCTSAAVAATLPQLGCRPAFLAAVLYAAWLGESVARAFRKKTRRLGGLAVYAVASTFCALAPSVAWLVVARVLQGIAIGVIDDAITCRRSLVVMAPLLSGLVSSIFGWHAVYVGLALVAACMAVTLDDVAVIDPPASSPDRWRHRLGPLSSRLYVGAVGVRLMVAATTASLLTVLPSVLASNGPAIVGALLAVASLGLTVPATDCDHYATVRAWMSGAFPVLALALICIAYWARAFPSVTALGLPLGSLVLVVACLASSSANARLDAHADRLYLRELPDATAIAHARHLFRLLQTLAMALASVLTVLAATPSGSFTAGSAYEALAVCATITTLWYWTLLGLFAGPPPEVLPLKS